MIPLNTKIMIRVINTATDGIHNGDVTHHQDHLATSPQPPSLSVRNIRNRIVPNPKPAAVFLLSAILFIFYIVKIRYSNVSTKLKRNFF